jgi:hypothetical protein
MKGLPTLHLAEKEIIDVFWYEPGSVLHQFHSHYSVQSAVSVSLLFALFAVDIFDAALLSNENDAFLHIMLLVSFLILSADIVLKALFDPAYRVRSLFFWFDLCGTLSLLCEIPWALSSLGLSNGSILRGASVTVRYGLVAGTKIVRATRLGQALRPGSNHWEQDKKTWKQVRPFHNTVTQKVNDRVALTVMLMALVTPALSLHSADDSQELFLRNCRLTLDPGASSMTTLTDEAAKVFFDIHAASPVRPSRLYFQSNDGTVLRAWDAASVASDTDPGPSSRGSTFYNYTLADHGSSVDGADFVLELNTAPLVSESAIRRIVFTTLVLLLLFAVTALIEDAIRARIAQPMARVLAKVNAATEAVMVAFHTVVVTHNNNNNNRPEPPSPTGTPRSDGSYNGNGSPRGGKKGTSGKPRSGRAQFALWKRNANGGSANSTPSSSPGGSPRANSARSSISAGDVGVAGALATALASSSRQKTDSKVTFGAATDLERGAKGGTRESFRRRKPGRYVLVCSHTA